MQCIRAFKLAISSTTLLAGVIISSIINVQSANALEKVTVQLKWFHHFQFAGYYAALERGFYRDAGLDVTIVEGGPDVEVEEIVNSGKADFGVGTSAILLNRAKGQDLVVLAQIFQHSPAVFLTPRKSGIRSVADMKGRRFMYSNQHGDMLALLKENGMIEQDITNVPHQGDPHDLINGKADVMIAYNFNEPFIMEQAGEPYLMFSPLSHGIDFYGDNLFTTRKLADENPKSVAAFRNATLRGWKYALTNKAEISELILKKYSKHKSKDWLLYEANQLETLIQPALVELGYQNPDRWRQIAQTFQNLGMLPPGFDPRQLIYEPIRPVNYRSLIIPIVATCSILIVLSALTIRLFRLNRRLSTEIEERKQAEEARTESEFFVRESQQAASIGSYKADFISCSWESSEVLDQIFGFDTNSDRSFQGWLDIVHPDDREMMDNYLRQEVIAKRLPFKKEYRIIRKSDGEVRWVNGLGKASFNDAGATISLIGTVQDITERKRIEQALRASESRHRAMINAFDGFVYICSPELRIEFMNERLKARTGRDATGEFCHEVFHDFDKACSWCPADRISAGKSIRWEVQSPQDNRWYEVSNTPIYHGDGSISTQAMITDITDRKLAELALQESEERFRSVTALSPDIISIINAEGKLLFNSSAAYSIHGYTQEDLVGQNTFDLIHPEDQEKVGRIFSELLNNPLQTRSVRYRYRNKDRSYAWMECSAINQLENPLINGIIAISRNIDEQKKLEEERNQLERQLLHTQKLESLGVLAGGIAHDFNNILTAIVGNADLALMRLNKESPATENLHRIEKAATRATDLAKQMLAYSGKGRFVVESLNLNRLLEEMLHILEVSISKKAELRLNLSPSLPSVEADATQIRQIIMNIVLNASEAIGDCSGVIAITTGYIDGDRSHLDTILLRENMTAGRYICLEITDTGCGMDKETLSKLFDPFFTTKFTGRGLGMAAVLGIVRGHKGAIKVDSEPGKGTTFKVLLPASDKPAGVSERESLRDEWRGRGTVLLVDDEETVRDIGSEMLKTLGFTPNTANDGLEAVALFKNTPDIAFVILDLTMPHMDGAECFCELKKLKPDIKVVMSSGFSEHEVTQKFAGQGLAGFVQKPYTLSALREVLLRI